MVETSDLKTDIIQNLEGLSEEDRTIAWANWVRSEVNAALDIYLPIALSGQINVKYYPRVIEVLENGPALDETKASGVLLSVVLEFEKPIDLTKQRVE